MKFFDTIFGNDCSKFINNAIYSKTKFDNIYDSYSELENILISGELEFPKINTVIEGLIDTSNVLYFNIYKNLISHNSGSATGFDKFKIADVANPDITTYLMDLPTEYQGLELQLHNIYKYINKNIDHFNLLLYLISNIDTILNKQVDIQKFDYYTNLFRFLYNRQGFEFNPSSGWKDSQLVSIPTIIQLYFFKQLYSLTSKTVNLILDDIYSYMPVHPILDKLYLNNEFQNYILTNSTQISLKLKNYIINNSLSFGIRVSPNVSTLLYNRINSIIINKLPILLTKLGSAINPSDFIYKILDSAFQNICYTNLIHSFQDSNSFIWNFNQFANYDQDVQDKLYQYEYVITNNLGKHITKKIEDLQMINNIPIKYTSNPIFFINSHSIIHAYYTLNYIQGSEVFTYNDLDIWLEHCIKFDDLKVNNIINYINSNPLIYDDSSFNFAALLVLKESIERLVDSEDFIKFVAIDLIPVIDKEIKLQYKIDINWHEFVEPILYIFKNIFINDLLDSLKNKTSTKLFYNITSQLSTMLKNKLPITPVNIDKITIKSIADYEVKDNKKWYYLFNSYFKSSFVARTLQTYLQNTYSLT